MCSVFMIMSLRYIFNIYAMSSGEIWRSRNIMYYYYYLFLSCTLNYRIKTLQIQILLRLPSVISRTSQKQDKKNQTKLKQHFGVRFEFIH